MDKKFMLLTSEQPNGYEYKNKWLIRKYKKEVNTVEFWRGIEQPLNYWKRNNYKQIY